MPIFRGLLLLVSGSVTILVVTGILRWGDEPMTDESSADTERWAPALAQQAAALRREMSSTGLRLLHGDASMCMEVAES